LLAKVGALLSPWGGNATARFYQRFCWRGIGLAARGACTTIGEIDAAFATLAREPTDALFVAADSFFNSRGAQFATLTARERIASAFSDRAMVAAGGLMSD